MTSQLDCDFYTSFYSDASSLSGSIAINEHYLNIGKPMGRVANKNELGDVLALILNFDQNVYLNANLCHNLKDNLKTKFNFQTNAECIHHYFNEDNGNLYFNKKFRVMNQNDLKIMSNLWNNIYNKIMDSVHFNLLFYKTFYDIPSNISTLRDLEINWLKKGLFLGEHPNLKSLNLNNNVVGMVQTILINEFGLDMAMVAQYKDAMIQYMTANSMNMLTIADETSMLLYLFLNTAYDLRLFFNNNDLENCKSERKEQYNKAVENVKNSTYKQLIAENDKMYDTKSLALVKSTPKYLIVPILKSPFEEIISMTNVVKLSNDIVINCFKKIHNTEDLTQVITLIVKHELSNCLNPVINSMELKILVTSIVYNAYIINKVDSKLYKDMVKEKSVKIISSLFSENNMTDFDAVLEQDINFIIENKKIIKLSYLKNVLIKIAIETFLLNL
jgi:hypothetical protein